MTEINDKNIIWYPADYTPLVTGGYGVLVKDTEYSRLETLVIERAEQDGEYCIANGLVGPNNESEPKMRQMMAFVSDPKNIAQAYDYVIKNSTESTYTVDYICRDLAQASLFVFNRKAAQRSDVSNHWKV